MVDGTLERRWNVQLLGWVSNRRGMYIMQTGDVSNQAWSQYLDHACDRLRQGTSLEVRGTLTRLAGLVLEARRHARSSGIAVCGIHGAGGESVLAEVVGFNGGRAYLMPAGDVYGLASGASVAMAPPIFLFPNLGWHPSTA